MKVLMGPTNFAGQPVELVKELQKRGIDAHLIQYGSSAFDYDTVEVVELGDDPDGTMVNTLKRIVEEDYDIVHLWSRSFFYRSGFSDLTGLDIPLLKSRGMRILYRFTGQELRLKSVQEEINPYNVYKYKYDHNIDEDLQRSYLDFLRHYVDQFVVQDREMHGYCPEASIIPRAIDTDDWTNAGVDEGEENPLVMHAPSSREVKGSWFIEEAVETLQGEGLEFRYKEVTDLPHEEAIERYKQADIIIDQLLVGWYGVLSLEAWALGKPVICYIREDLESDDIPVAEANPDTITDVLRELLENPEKRARLAMRGRDYVEEKHDLSGVTDQLIDLYEEVMEMEPVANRQPNEGADFDYLHAQYRDKLNQRWSLRSNIKQKEEEIKNLRTKVEKYDEMKEEVEELRYKVQRYEDLLE